MNKTHNRIIALLFIPCLVLDPSTAAALSLPTSSFSVAPVSRLSCEALGPVHLFENHVLSWWPSVKPWRFAIAGFALWALAVSGHYLRETPDMPDIEWAMPPNGVSSGIRRMGSLRRKNDPGPQVPTPLSEPTQPTALLVTETHQSWNYGDTFRWLRSEGISFTKGLLLVYLHADPDRHLDHTEFPNVQTRASAVGEVDSESLTELIRGLSGETVIHILATGANHFGCHWTTLQHLLDIQKSRGFGSVAYHIVTERVHWESSLVPPEAYSITAAIDAIKLSFDKALTGNISAQHQIVEATYAAQMILFGILPIVHLDGRALQITNDVMVEAMGESNFRPAHLYYWTNPGNFLDFMRGTVTSAKFSSSASVESAVNPPKSRDATSGEGEALKFEEFPHLAEDPRLGKVYALSQMGRELSQDQVMLLAQGWAHVDKEANLQGDPEIQEATAASLVRFLEQMSVALHRYVLISPQGQVTAFATMNFISHDRAQIFHMAALPEKDEWGKRVSGKGTFLLRTMLQSLTLTLESLELSAEVPSAGFYHQAAAGWVDYECRNGLGFYFYPKTYGKLSSTQERTQIVYRDRFRSRREEVIQRLSALPAGHYHLGAAKVEFDGRTAWTIRGIRHTSVPAIDFIADTLTYTPQPPLTDEGGNTSIEGSNITEIRCVTSPVEVTSLSLEKGGAHPQKSRGVRDERSHHIAGPQNPRHDAAIDFSGPQYYGKVAYGTGDSRSDPRANGLGPDSDAPQRAGEKSLQERKAIFAVRWLSQTKWAHHTVGFESESMLSPRPKRTPFKHLLIGPEGLWIHLHVNPTAVQDPSTLFYNGLLFRVQELSHDRVVLQDPWIEDSFARDGFISVNRLVQEQALDVSAVTRLTELAQIAVQRHASDLLSNLAAKEPIMHLLVERSAPGDPPGLREMVSLRQNPGVLVHEVKNEKGVSLSRIDEFGDALSFQNGQLVNGLPPNWWAAVVAVSELRHQVRVQKVNDEYTAYERRESPRHDFKSLSDWSKVPEMAWQQALLIQPGDSILHVGAGLYSGNTGVRDLWIVQATLGASVTLTDLDPKTIEPHEEFLRTDPWLGQLTSRITLDSRVIDAARLSSFYVQQSFRQIALFNGFSYIYFTANPWDVLREMLSLIQVGGYLVLTDDAVILTNEDKRRGLRYVHDFLPMLALEVGHRVSLVFEGNHWPGAHTKVLTYQIHQTSLSPKLHQSA
jgi:hypothetical protein